MLLKAKQKRMGSRYGRVEEERAFLLQSQNEEDDSGNQLTSHDVPSLRTKEQYYQNEVENSLSFSSDQTYYHLLIDKAFT